MASVFKRDGFYVVYWKDARGVWRQKRTQFKTKAQAQALARDLEAKADRQRAGLEVFERAGDDLTFADLFEWWVKEFGSKLRSTTAIPFARKHLLPVLGDLRLPDVSPGSIETLLAKKDGELKPKSINNLRQVLYRIFNLAIRCEKWGGENPVEKVERRKVPKRLPTVIAYDEVPLLLGALADHWRPLYATAVYTGMRQGELLGLRKSDVNLDERVIYVCRSYDANTTKGGAAEAIPIADDLIMFLKTAIEASKSELVFPRKDGSMHNGDLALDRILRRALGRAGIVTSYEHGCRRQGCGYTAPSKDKAAGRCPKCNMKLRSKPIPRHVRFHDLRHSTATLLLKAGVPAAAVQRMLRHKDARLTLQTYGHLDIEDMRQGINAMDLGLNGTPERVTRAAALEEQLRILANHNAPVMRNPETSIVAKPENANSTSDIRRLLRPGSVSDPLVPNQVLYQAEPLPDVR